ncbi:isoprenylcysteine carboxylmethyltransferase family protein [Novosphingobium flavum]|uniref:Isoprenylcysteine carboxylmethyltransferase family protein n=1 Tax=Novosphingobium aerophilum TaxID=2839843 RepID=A0A7X1F7N6_9SPHN|nr:isoprenylcysteine carboxylmethyltransferase family protein [Novosphingobium aerophilum]MBC2651901.1 isoprenylcysteine carboxylmethyltransferase family protein [Novosphingobium aerophilum]MBC2661700.1 isoprenylcysteine carboxylmethyltransferase family protein [Novosphingobium aerophilum]
MTTTTLTKQPAWLRPAVLDRAEQVLVVLLWIVLASRVEVSSNPWSVLLLISETAVAVFTLIRRPTEKLSMALGDWLLAMTATCAGLLVLPGVPPLPLLVPLGVFLAVVGNGIQAWAKLTLRRSFGVAPANRGIKISGPYRFVRHPMYAGYALVHMAVMILMFHPMNIVIYAIGWWAQILRLLAEERLLSQDPAYAEYMQVVRWRLIPGLF